MEKNVKNRNLTSSVQASVIDIEQYRMDVDIHRIDHVHIPYTRSINIKDQSLFYRHTHQFLKGPITLAWLEQASKLPGKTYIVGTLLWYRRGVTRNVVVTMSGPLLKRFGISRQAANRALHHLEDAGLVRLTHRVGKKTMVEILDVGGID